MAERDIIAVLSKGVGWQRLIQLGDYLRSRSAGTKAYPQPVLKEYTAYCPSGKDRRCLPVDWLIGPVMEITVIQYPREGKKIPLTGIAVLVPSSDPEPHKRYACINVTQGKVPYAY